jgi:hypothetical protein
MNVVTFAQKKLCRVRPVPSGDAFDQSDHFATLPNFGLTDAANARLYRQYAPVWSASPGWRTGF